MSGGSDALVSTTVAAGLSVDPLERLLEHLDHDEWTLAHAHDVVRLSVTARHIADEAQVLAVRRARALGATWEQIGEMLGVSGAGAHARLARRM
ncbi:hypothetical protein [Dietzia sp. Die43]|uniref:hypothetical protein n=1 Tax=Dietzia sp. Die43 TaxID=2926011 RepID=UPI0021174AC8|nr:hypothetical protein [Dietzia sp. Die43]